MEKLIDKLLCFFYKTGFYVLGAGASAPIVPITNQLRNKIIRRYYNVGLFRTDIPPNNALTPKLIGEVDEDDFILEGMSDNFTKAAVMHELSQHHHNVTSMPYQYLIFNLIKKPSIIFNMNHDGLAGKYCQGHIILNPHGTISSYYGTEIYDDILDSIAIYDLPVKSDNLTFFTKEKNEILHTPPYVCASCFFKYAECLLIIGYKFGTTEFGMDDVETFNALFESWYQYNKIPIMVIMPNKDIDSVERIKDIAKTKQIYFIEAYWNYLAQAIFEIYYNSSSRPYPCNILARYNRLLEKA